MSQQRIVATIAGLDQKEPVRVTLDDGTTVEGRVNQLEYDVEERLRVELEVRDSEGRYQVYATFTDGDWQPVEVRHASSDRDDAEEESWETLGTVSEVTPLKS